MIAGHCRYNHIDVLVLSDETLAKATQLVHKFCRVISQAFLEARHLEIVGFEPLVAKVLSQSIGKFALATAGNSCDKDQ